MTKNNKSIRNLGSITRTIRCSKCDKSYRGNPKTVDKLMKLHSSKVHKEKSEIFPRTETANLKIEIKLNKHFGIQSKTSRDIQNKNIEDILKSLE